MSSPNFESDSDGFVVYHQPQDQVHYLNRTAAVVLELCDGERDLEEIVIEVSKLFNVDENACKSDVGTCVESLLGEQANSWQ